MTSRERCRVCGSTAVETHPRLPVERCGNCKEHRPAAAAPAARIRIYAPEDVAIITDDTGMLIGYRVVDAAREDLAAEVARVTAERDQARAELAQLRSPVFLPTRRGSDD